MPKILKFFSEWETWFHYLSPPFLNAVSLGAANMEIHHAVEQEMGHRQGCKHGNNNAEAQRGRKADDCAGTHPEQHRGRNQRGDVGVRIAVNARLKPESIALLTVLPARSSS